MVAVFCIFDELLCNEPVGEGRLVGILPPAVDGFCEVRAIESCLEVAQRPALQPLTQIGLCSDNNGLRAQQSQSKLAEGLSS